MPVTLPEITHDKSSVLSITGRDSLIFFSIEGSLNQGLHKIIYNEPAPGRSYAARISRNGNYSSCLVGDTLYGGSFNKIFKYEVKFPYRQFHISKLNPPFFIWSIAPFKNGKIWLGGLGDERRKAEVVLFDPAKNKVVNRIDGPTNETVNSILYDTTSEVTWFARDNGLFASFESPFEYFTMDNNENILDIGFSGDSLLVLTLNGVYFLDKARIVLVTAREQALDKLLSGHRKYPLWNGEKYAVNDLTYTDFVSFIKSDKKLFIHTQIGAISVPDLKTYLPFLIGPLLLMGERTIYYHQKYDTLRFNSDYRNLKGWMVPEGPEGKAIDVTQLIDSKNVIYCRTNTSGLYAVNKNIVYHLSEENSVIGNILTGMDKDMNGYVWCTSADQRLFMVDFSDSLYIKREFNLLKMGLEGNICKWIKFSGKYLLIGTNSGLNVINMDRLFSDNPYVEYFYNSFNGYDFISAESPVSDGRSKVYLHNLHNIISIDTNFINHINGEVYLT